MAAMQFCAQLVSGALQWCRYERSGTSKRAGGCVAPGACRLVDKVLGMPWASGASLRRSQTLSGPQGPSREGYGSQPTLVLSTYWSRGWLLSKRPKRCLSQPD